MMRFVLHFVFCWLVASAAWAQPPNPLLWKVGDADSSVYLLGSMHVLTRDDYPMAAVVESAFADSTRVVFEVAPDSLDKARLSQLMLRTGQRSDGKTLQQVLPAATWTALEAYARMRGMEPAALQNYKPWLVALMVLMGETVRMGMDPALGLDQHFETRAVAAGKATAGLESVESQIALFDGMGAQAELEFLQETLGDVPRFKAQMDELLQAWRQADEAVLERIALRDVQRDYPALYQRINVARNRAWLPQIEALLRESHRDSALVVVGAMHLLGADGLVYLLQQRGYRVERVQ